MVIMGHRDKSDDHDQIQLLLAENFTKDEPEVIQCRMVKHKSKHEHKCILPEPERGTNMYIIGCLLSVTASCLRAFSMAGSQMLDDVVGEFQLNVGRFGSMLGFLMPYLIYARPNLLLSRKSIIPVIILSLVTFACNIFIYASTVYIPVGTANTVINVSFLTIILATTVVNICWGGVLWSARSLIIDIISVLLTCIGVVFVIQPDIFFSKMEYFKMKDSENYTSFCNPHRFDEQLNRVNTHNIAFGNNITSTEKMTTDQIDQEMLVEIYKHESWKGYIHAILAGLFNALRVIFNKRILSHEGIYPVMFWTALIATFASVISTILFEKFMFPASVICTLIVFGHASATGFQTVLLVAGMKFVPSTDLTLLYSFTVALLFAFQFTILKAASPAPHNSVAILAAVLVSAISIGKPIIESFHARYSVKKK